MFHRDTRSSGIDHAQIPTWSLECSHGQFNDLSTLQCKKEKIFNELSRKGAKNFLSIVMLHDEKIQGLFQLNASRLVHDELS